MGPKLHEVLAVEPSLEKTANRLMKESQHTFSKDSLFKGFARYLEMFKDEDKRLETSEEQKLETTVDENLDYIVPHISKWLDANLQKEKTNQVARADLDIPGVGKIEGLPATFLLGLETKLVKVRQVYEQIPTLPPGINWVEDPMERPGVYKTSIANVQFKTKKDPEFRTVAPATKEHPAQVQKVDRTIETGKYVTTGFCGMMTPFEKAERITRIDFLLREVKKARMRANNAEVVKDRIGEKIFEYINGH